MNILAKFRKAVIMALQQKREDEDMERKVQIKQKKKKLITQQKLHRLKSHSKMFPNRH